MERNKPVNLSRREFLANLGKIGISAYAVTKFGLSNEVDAQSEIDKTTRIDVPPSLMLHARHKHEKLLPELLGKLKDNGFTGITYRDLLKALKGESELPSNPVIISIDDLSMARGVPSFTTFQRMAETLIQNDFPGVFAINTKPNEEQDNDRWNQIKGWMDYNIEFATHTALHTNLDNKDLSSAGFHAEIVDSANEIAARTGQSVSSLILPFGNGYNIETDVINRKIVDACHEANIQMVVGILGGRDPLPVNSLNNNNIYAVGRVTPGIQGEETAATAMWEVNHWK